MVAHDTHDTHEVAMIFCPTKAMHYCKEQLTPEVFCVVKLSYPYKRFLSFLRQKSHMKLWFPYSSSMVPQCLLDVLTEIQWLYFGEFKSHVLDTFFSCG